MERLPFRSSNSLGFRCIYARFDQCSTTSIDEIARREGCTKQHVANNIPLAFLAPDVVRAIIDARLPRGISARRIAQPELEWARQWEMLGIRR